MADNAQTMHPRAFIWGHVLEEQERIRLRHPLHSVEAQKAPAAAQETPGMSLCPYKSLWVPLICKTGSGCSVWPPLHLAELFATCSLTPRQADCNNTGYLFSCASPVCPGEKRYVLASLITSFFAGVNKRSHGGLSLLVRFFCAQGLLQETPSLLEHKVCALEGGKIELGCYRCYRGNAKKDWIMVQTTASHPYQQTKHHPNWITLCCIQGGTTCYHTGTEEDGGKWSESSNQPWQCWVSDIAHWALSGPVLHHLCDFQKGPLQPLVKGSALKRRKVLQ